MNCKVCGKEIEANENGTCSECHEKIIKRLNKKKADTKKYVHKFCSNCGKELESEWNFCNYCGEKLKEKNDADVTNTKNSSKYKRPIIVIITIIAIFFICIANKSEYMENKESKEYATINNNISNKENSNFDLAIECLKSEMYNDAYTVSKSIENSEDKATIQNIIDYIFLLKTTNAIDVMVRSSEYANDVIENHADQLILTGKINISIYEKELLEEYVKEIEEKVIKISTDMPQSIISSDLHEYYEMYFETTRLVIESHRNLEVKLNNEDSRNKLQRDAYKVADSFTVMEEDFEHIYNRHPLENIEEKYQTMFDLTNTKGTY